ncbi:MAG: ABC transporter substrate-binding protein [Actinomycetota bacterium]|nr:ABC transporter substrate-binding protein [Actinomycetota bacterium]
MNQIRRRWTAIAAATAFALVVTACGGSDETSSGAETSGPANSDVDTSAVLRMPLPTPQLLDPVRTVSVCDVAVFSTLYDTLVRVDPDGTLVPGIAESWEAPDDTTFVLNLREGVEFSDGTPFDAEAVKAAIERGQTDPESVMATTLEPIERVEVVDPHTLRLELSKPVVGLMPAVFQGRAGMIPSPVAVEAAGADYGTTAESVVGAGPYKINEFESKGNFGAEAWDGYWDEENRMLGGVKFTNTQGATSGYGPFITRLAQGEFDALSMKEADIAVAQAQPDLEVLTGPSELMMHLMINYAQAPFDQLEVRQALQHAIDRDALNEAIALGLGTPAEGPLPPTSWAYDSAVEGMYPYDVDKAKDLLTKAGHPDGIEFEAVTPDTSLYVQLATAVQDMLKDAGINMKIRTVPGQEINTELYVSKSAPAGISAWSESTDPGEFFGVKYASDGSNNAAGAAIEGLDELLAEGAATTDQAARAEAYAKAQELIMEQAIEVPLYFAPAVTVHSQKVQGIPKAYSTCNNANYLNPPISITR